MIVSDSVTREKNYLKSALLITLLFTYSNLNQLNNLEYYFLDDLQKKTKKHWHYTADRYIEEFQIQ